MSRLRLYRGLVAVAAGFVAWTLVHRFALDPRAAGFLARKTGIAHPLRLQAWLRMLDVHIAFACAAMLAGALNFSARLRRKRRTLHRAVGYAYLVSVVGVGVTSGYLAPYATGGRAVGMAFNLLNLLWLACTATAFIAVKRRLIRQHRRWMIRSYAFCFTNLAIHALTSLLAGGFGLRYETSYAFGVFGAIALLALAAELVVRRFPNAADER